MEDVLKMLEACDKLDTAAGKRLKVPVEHAKTAMRVIAMAAFSGLRKSEIQVLTGPR